LRRIGSPQAEALAGMKREKLLAAKKAAETPADKPAEQEEPGETEAE
jgi:hypothetical protein